MQQALLRLWHDEDGQGMVEYGLIIALVSVGLIVALTKMKGGVDKVYSNITTAVTDVSKGK